MDTNNWRHTQGGEPGIDAGDWRSQLQPDSRQRSVNRIMETLKRHLPVSSQEEFTVLQNIAVMLEEEIYTAATSPSDYLRNIYLKMLNMETKSQPPMGTSLPSYPMVPINKPLDSASLDSTGQTGQANGGDWQEEIYQKIKAMKELYFLELEEMYQKILPKVNQFENLPQTLKLEQLNKLKQFTATLERLLTFLQLSKDNVAIELKDKIGHYEKEIVSFLNSDRRRNRVVTLQSQSQMTPLQSLGSKINPQLHSANMQGFVAPMLLHNNMNNMQHDSLPTFSGSAAQHSMMKDIVDLKKGQIRLEEGQKKLEQGQQEVTKLLMTMMDCLNDRLSHSQHATERPS